jgi:general secretion pathway protein G
MVPLHNRPTRPRTLRQGGFTLIELLVVIAILSVLAAIVVFNVTGVKGTSEDAACRTDISSVQSAIDSYVSNTASAGTARLDGLIAGSRSGSSYALPGPSSPFWTNTVSVGGRTYALVSGARVDDSYLQRAPELASECAQTPATLTWADGTDSAEGYTVSGK